MAMRKLRSAMVVVFSMGMTDFVFSQDFEKGLKAYQEQDYTTALKEWTVLADRGHIEAQHKLGLMYAFGHGVVQDSKKAVTLYRKSAEQGYAAAQNNLASMFFIGDGVLQDYKDAELWYRKSAEQGDALGQSALGFLYKEGYGVIQDNVYAHMWYNIAASNGYKSASEGRNEIVKKMTATEIAKAQEIARECVKKQYKGC